MLVELKYRLKGGGDVIGTYVSMSNALENGRKLEGSCVIEQIDTGRIVWSSCGGFANDDGKS